MQKTAKIGWVLKLALFVSGKKQKDLAVDSRSSNATVSDHLNDGSIPIDKAIDYLIAMKKNGYQNVNELTSEISYSYLGFFKAMDGKLAEVKSTNDLEVFQEIEMQERKERKTRAQLLVALSQIKALDKLEKADLRKYVDEFLDEIIVEMAIVFSILKILGLSIQEVINDRMPHWIKKKYMKG